MAVVYIPEPFTKDTFITSPNATVREIYRERIIKLYKRIYPDEIKDIKLFQIELKQAEEKKN